MDINAGRIISEGASLDDVADDIIDAIKETASGRMTKAEKLGHVEFVLTYKDFNYGKPTAIDPITLIRGIYACIHG